MNTISTDRIITTDKIILRPADIVKLYGFTQNEAYEILHQRDCPTITGNKNMKSSTSKRQRWTVEKSAFEDYITRRTR